MNSTAATSRYEAQCKKPCMLISMYSGSLKEGSISVPEPEKINDVIKGDPNIITVNTNRVQYPARIKFNTNRVSLLSLFLCSMVCLQRHLVKV